MITAKCYSQLFYLDRVREFRTHIFSSKIATTGFPKKVRRKYAVWTSRRSKVDLKSNFIKFGSAHEWSRVWTGPFNLIWNISEEVVHCTAVLSIYRQLPITSPAIAKSHIRMYIICWLKCVAICFRFYQHNSSLIKDCFFFFFFFLIFNFLFYFYF